ncbi:uncharacterized protein LOC144708275 [Wolffia australiana]
MANNGDESLATVDEGLSGVRQGESDSPQVQDAGRPNFIFPPPEVKFDGGNMFEWSKMVTLTLYGCKLGDHLTNDPRAASDPEYKKWRAEESLILSWMLRSMTPEMRRDFLYCDIVKETWDDIQKYSEEQSHDCRIYELNVQATQARQGTDNVLQILKTESSPREIDYLWPTHNPQLVERQYILKHRLFTFLMGLNPTYESVRSQLLHREKLPSLEEAIGAIRQAESRLRVAFDPQTQNSAAFLSRKPEAKAAPNTSWPTRPPPPNLAASPEGEDSRDALFYAYCKRRRHTKENCWKLAWKNQNAGKKAYVSTSQPQNSGAAGTSQAVEEVQEKLSSTSLVKSGNSSPHDWIADTGATDHMSPDASQFSEYSPAEVTHRVQTAGDGYLSVKGVGKIRVPPLGLLKEVLHVEGLRTNLISIQKVVDDLGCQFILDSDDCFLYDKVSGRKISSFRREVPWIDYENFFRKFVCSLDFLLEYSDVWYVVFNETELYSTAENVSATTQTEQGSHVFEFLRHLTPDQTYCSTATPAGEIEVNTSGQIVDDAEDELIQPSDEQGEPAGAMDNQINPEEELTQEVPEHSLEDAVADTNVEAPDDDSGWPIALRKGVRSCRAKAKYPISHYVKHERLSSQYRSFLTLLGEIVVPDRVEDALRDSGWKAAMDDEMYALMKNDTWEITSLPKGKKAVGCRWVFTPKFLADTTLERLKARLVAKGYTQTEGIDYGETFAPVAKFNTVRVLIALAAKCDWEIFQFDVKNAFLHGELEEEVYMQLPPGYRLTEKPNQVCRLKKALNGLKQSPRAWFGRFTKAMVELNYYQARGDHALFIKKGAGGAVTVLLVYVDDILVTGGDIKEIDRLTKALSKQFDMKELGPLKYFLGIEVAYSNEGISLSQHKYTLDLLQETGHLGCKPATTPLDINVKIGKGDDGAAVDKHLYQRLIGKLTYLNHTRPDISYAVSLLSQLMSEPYEIHLRAAYRILAYLKFTVGQGLLFTREGGLTLEAYTDSDWAGSVIDRRSTSGYCTLLGGSLVTWRSKKQKEVSLSSAEAELRALKRGVLECRWLKHLLEDIGLYDGEGIKLYCDNQSALAIARNPVQHDRTKHMAINRHYLSENIDRGIIRPEYIPSVDQKADIFTKPLPDPRFQQLVSKLGMVNIHT